MLIREPVLKPTYRRLIVLTIFLVFIALLVLIYPSINDLLGVMVIALVLTYIFKPGVNFLEHHGIHRVISILSIFILGTAFIVLGIRYFVPIILDEAAALVIRIEEIDLLRFHKSVITWIDQRIPGLTPFLGVGEDQATVWIEQIRATTNNFLQQSVRLVAGAANLIGLAIVLPFLTFFLLKDSSYITKSIIERIPNRYFEMSLSLVYRIDQQLGNYIRSILLESLIISLLSWLALEVMGVKFALVLGVTNGLLNMIPFFGPVIAYIPIGLVILLTYNPVGWGLFWMFIILIGIQFIDNILAKPLLISRSVHIHPVLVLLAVLIGGRLAGPIGMFIAVPAFAVIQVIVIDAYNHLKAYRII